MIAEAGSRRKGIAKEALLIMMVHGHDRLVRPTADKVSRKLQALTQSYVRQW